MILTLSLTLEGVTTAASGGPEFFRYTRRSQAANA